MFERCGSIELIVFSVNANVWIWDHHILDSNNVPVLDWKPQSNLWSVNLQQLLVVHDDHVAPVRASPIVHERMVRVAASRPIFHSFFHSFTMADSQEARNRAIQKYQERVREHRELSAKVKNCTSHLKVAQFCWLFSTHSLLLLKDYLVQIVLTNLFNLNLWHITESQCDQTWRSSEQIMTNPRMIWRLFKA